MRRRALLSTSALCLCSAGCLGRLRRQQSGPLRLDHARGTLHDASASFVRGGLGGEPRGDSSYAAWLFTTPPSSDVTVFTDALGDEDQREWDNEVHNENYDDGFCLLAQVRTPRAHAVRLSPVTTGCDAAWTGLRNARLPLWLYPADQSNDHFPGGDHVVATLLVYFTSDAAPGRATVPFLSERATDCESANASPPAEQWSPP